jgi:hypothetical protein
VNGKPENRLKHIPLLLLISLGLTTLLYFVDEGLYSLTPLLRAKEVMILMTFTLFFSVFPIGINQFALDSRFRKNAFLISLIGYLPIVFIFCLPLFL